MKFGQIKILGGKEKITEIEKQIYLVSQIQKAIVFLCFLENFFSKFRQIGISKGKEKIT